jgi:hypothetical protein
MSPAEMDALLAEMEPDILSADRDLREIAVLEKKGVAGAGRLAEYEALQPRLEALLESHAQDVVRANELEARIAGLIEKYASHVRFCRSRFRGEMVAHAKIRWMHCRIYS